MTKTYKIKYQVDHRKMEKKIRFALQIEQITTVNDS